MHKTDMISINLHINVSAVKRHEKNVKVVSWHHLHLQQNTYVAGQYFEHQCFDIHRVSKKVYHPTTNDNFNNSCPIPVIFGTNIAE